jgi:hypothetical protein
VFEEEEAHRKLKMPGKGGIQVRGEIGPGAAYSGLIGNCLNVARSHQYPFMGRLYPFMDRQESKYRKS